MLQYICPGIFWLGCFAFGGFALANEASAAPSANVSAHYKTRRWTTEDGLPQNRIAYIQQTRDGYLWLGTWFGLARFDGVRFTVFNKQNTPALANDAISALAEDADGALWIGTKAGLVKYRAGKFSRFTVGDGLPSDEIWRLTAARTGGVWLQAGDKIVRGEHDQFRTVWQHAFGDNVHALQEDADGRLNIFLDHQWLVWSPDTGRMQTNFAEPVNHECLLNAALAGSPDVAFAGTGNGLRRLEFGNTNLIFAGGLADVRAGFLLRDRAGMIWAQTRPDSLMRFDGTNWQTVHLGEMRSDVVSTAQDAQGNFWFGTADGLVQVQFPKVRAVTTRDGLPSDNVGSVCESADGTIWAGTAHGLALIQSNRVAALEIPGSNPAQAISCAWPSRAGGIWVASRDQGIFKLENGRWSQVMKGALPTALYEDKSGRLWIATSGPVHFFQNGQLQTAAAGTESLWGVHAILEDRVGDFWFGLKNGELARLHGGQLSIFTNSLADGYVWAIHEAADGALWLGTEKGLVRFARGKFFQFTASQQMPEDEINCVLEDDVNNLWFSTLHGIFRVERARLNAVADGKTATVQPFILGTADGMKSSESNGGTQPAGWKARDGRLWFPTGKGLVVIDPKLFSEKENPPCAVLESVKADGQELGTEKKINIAAGHGQALEFHFTACDLSAPEQVRFQTRLVGVDETWSEPSPNRAANYFNLHPGNYHFEVRAMDHHGQWSARPASLDVSIAPQFWQTWWFYVLCGAAVITLAGGVQAYRLRWQQRLFKLEQQRAVSNERARIARDLHDDLGTALTGVALELDQIGRETKNHPVVVERLAKASEHTRQLAGRMREVVWVVNPRCDNLRSLADFLGDQAAQLLRASGLNVRMEFPPEIPDLPVEANVRHQLALSVREAFSNLVRHANASEAAVRVELNGTGLTINIRDNGCGFEPETQIEMEHGMNNMRKRMEEIGGLFYCVSAPGKGTTIQFKVPLLGKPSGNKKL
jgi:signal transduction histidine kinase/ligand-binding sensor domain-containing protein